LLFSRCVFATNFDRKSPHSASDLFRERQDRQRSRSASSRSCSSSFGLSRARQIRRHQLQHTASLARPAGSRPRYAARPEADLYRCLPSSCRHPANGRAASPSAAALDRAIRISHESGMDDDPRMTSILREYTRVLRKLNRGVEAKQVEKTLRSPSEKNICRVPPVRPNRSSRR